MNYLGKRTQVWCSHGKTPNYHHLNLLLKFLSRAKFNKIHQLKFPFLQWRLQHWFVKCWYIKIQALVRICTFDLVLSSAEQWHEIPTSIPCTCRWLKARSVVCMVKGGFCWYLTITVYLTPQLWGLSTDLGLGCKVTHQPRACLSSLSCKLVSTPSYLVSSKSSNIAWLFIQEYVNVGLKFKC